ncbi:MAG TPA: glycosyltransferase family 4 protein [Acidobacteriota bacterium]|jgi:glycosyltransferase involved in cell wall biosynthesis
MTTLVITDKSLANEAEPYDRRVWYLSRELARLDSLVLVPIACSERDRGKVSLDPRDLFDEVAEPLVLPHGRPSIMRHLRWRDANYYSLGYPRYYREAVDLISSMLKRHSASRIVAVCASLAGFLLPFRSEKVLMDTCDSTALYLERDYAVRSGMTLVEKASSALARWRWINNDARLPHWFTHVITLSDIDTQAIRRMSGGCSNVTTIPMGIPPFLEQPLARRNGPRKPGVVFWGNLAFPPNVQAMRFFLEKVYEPYLAAAGVEWCIVGRGAEPWVEAAARRYPLIRVTGFVEDLYALVSEYPIMINPMVSGGGIKNKVLEALALEMAVVSTPLGMESIAGAVNGRHYVEASTPEEMAESVLALLKDPTRCEALGSNARQLILAQYTWEHVGKKLRSVLEAM